MRTVSRVSAFVLAASLCAVSVRFGVAPAFASPEQAAATSCDYACLTSIVDQYLKAVVAHDASQIQITQHVRFTENTIPLKLGDALWGTMSGLGTYKLYFADPRDGSAGIEATIRENGTPAILLLRLKVVDRKISEIETLVHRNADDATALEKFGDPNPAWTRPLEPAQRISRAQMVTIANSYFDGILHAAGDSVPFDPTCNRILDGYQDTNNPKAKGWFDKGSFRPDAMDIRANMNTHIWSYIHSIDPRHIVVVDEKIGIVVGMFMFNHPGRVKFADVPGVGKVPMPPVTQRPSSVLMGEFFKIEAGKIREIEGVSIALPFGAKTGWDTAAGKN
ncbi:MAG: hypothetical protein WCC21_17095 [Candidatus Acidiferrales bacterium]